jgi:hypothetical protein
MAVIPVAAGPGGNFLLSAGSGALCTALAVTNGAGPQDSTNTIQRGVYYYGGAIVLANTGGATPTSTVNIMGSMDNVNFYNIPYSLVATPRTFVVSAITITTTATTTYLLQELVPWVYCKLTFATTTNETVTATVYM